MKLTTLLFSNGILLTSSCSVGDDTDFEVQIGFKRSCLLFSGGTPQQNPCYTGRHGCDTNAVCNPGQGNQFTCQCASGFTGDGRTCYGEPHNYSTYKQVFWLSYKSQSFINKTLQTLHSGQNQWVCVIIYMQGV